MIKSLARTAVATLLKRFDYRLVENYAEPMGLDGVCHALKKRGFHPSTVIDIGVGTGTPWLYAAFPKAKFELFEANTSFREVIERSVAGLDAKVHFCALGERRSKSSIEIDPAHPGSSTMARYSDRYIEAAQDDASRPTTFNTEVDVFPLDEFAPFKGPTLIKMDVEGYEGEVVKGATVALRETDVVISEVSVVRRTDRELSLSEFLSLMDSLGFSLINIAEVTQLGRGGPIAYMDVVLVRKDSPMRYGQMYR